jgi:hypothetical protein
VQLLSLPWSLSPCSVEQELCTFVFYRLSLNTGGTASTRLKNRGRRKLFITSASMASSGSRCSAPSQASVLGLKQSITADTGVLTSTGWAKQGVGRNCL